VDQQPAVPVEGVSEGLAMGGAVIFVHPCIHHSWFSIENKEEGHENDCTARDWEGLVRILPHEIVTLAVPPDVAAGESVIKC
jgi:hypothetical protein